MAIQVSYNPKKSTETWERESTALIKLSKVLDGLQASHNPNLRVGRRDCCKRQENRSDTCMEMVTWFIAIIQNVKAEASITI